MRSCCARYEQPSVSVHHGMPQQRRCGNVPLPHVRGPLTLGYLGACWTFWVPHLMWLVASDPVGVHS